MDNKILNKSITVREIIFFAFLLLCLLPFISPVVALLMGIVVAQSIGHPFLHLNHKATHILLQFSVVGLGFGMNVQSALQAGKSGFMFTVLSILITLILGYLLGRFLKIECKSAFLITVGTAICGGSAIAAISPVIKAEEKQISVALGTIFILNSVALFIFPLIGQSVQLSQQQFGVWSAIAIQDTSSVVGAASKYGAEALQIATTVKLTRALWIIPIALLSSVVFRNKGSQIKIPYFIGLFVLTIVLNTYLPFAKIIGSQIVQLSKIGLTLTLFLIGSGLSKDVFTTVGFKPILQGLILWVMISIPALLAVIYLLG